VSDVIKVTECMVRVSERRWLGTCVLVSVGIKVSECMVRVSVWWRAIKGVLEMLATEFMVSAPLCIKGGWK
jgi:hypothetical protein